MKTLYVSDLDGTLLNSDQQTSEYTNNTINELVSRGMLFSYATARSFHTSHKVTSGLNAKIPVIVYNGAMIVDHSDGSFLLKNFFDQDIRELCEDLFQCNIDPIVYSILDQTEKFSYIPECCTQGMSQFIESRRNDKRIRSVHNTEELLQGEIFYTTCIDDKSKLEPLYQKYKEKIPLCFST